MRLLRLSALALLLAGPAALAQSITVSAATVSLPVPFTMGGYGTATNAATTLSWTGENGNHQSKVTVGTTAPGQDFTLRLTATGALQGTPQGTVTLQHGAGAVDFVRNIPRRAIGLATLRYEASVPSGSGAGQDLHTVVFTITRQ